MAAKTGLPLQMFGRRLVHLRSSVTSQNMSALRLFSTEKQPEEAATTEQKATEASPEVEKLTKELAAAKEQNAELLDKYKRSLADSENMRNRLNKQISDAKIFGIQSFCKDLLEVADTLGHATQAVPKEKLSGNADLKNLYEGLSMTRASLLQVFKRHGLEPLDPINQKFDPNQHEALFQKEDKTVEANTVVEVTKLGYKLHERCIRPALVGVSKC
ncbi:grpE protein homolog, mitochondrial [Drosophila santomea]|uniref:grpE protein homolog, mitochondrial n=1 Tax=Drosophila santomea TaxID=129105 RepID=UPI0019540D0D|nr:grpE protein homolog, mitochondrial [Drosophila santomea]